MDCLVAHCPTSGCYMRVPVCVVTTGAKLEFDPALSVAVTCPNCGHKFQEAASSLERCDQADVTGKFQAVRLRAKS